MASLTLYAIGGLATLLVVGLAGVAYVSYARYQDAIDESLTQAADTGAELQFDGPDVRRSVVDLWRVTRHLQKASKAAKKGYVKWYLLDSQLHRPRWVKPTRDGAGMPKIEHDGQPYYFPDGAMVVDEQTGAYVAAHRMGEADPINLRDPAYPGIDADLVQRTIDLEAEDSPDSGLLSGVDLNQQTVLWGGMALLFVVYAAYYAVTHGWLG